MLHIYPENDNDRELRELLNVCWHPTSVVEGLPAAPDVQSLPNGRYGNIFDVLVDRPERAKAFLNYPVIWAAGDVELRPLATPLEEYVKAGGTLVVATDQAPKSKKRMLPDSMHGFKASNKFDRFEEWRPADGGLQATTPYRVERGELLGAEVLAWASKDVPLVVRNKVGNGAIITILIPHGLGLDERAHPVLPWLLNGLTQDLLPIQLEMANGRRPGGDIHYQVNRAKDGYVILLMNNRGVDKTQNGVARVDRRQFVDVVIRAKEPVKTAHEWTTPRDLAPEPDGMSYRIRVHPGDVQVIGLVTK